MRASLGNRHKAAHGLQTTRFGNLFESVFCHKIFNDGELCADFVYGFIQINHVLHENSFQEASGSNEYIGDP